MPDRRLNTDSNELVSHLKELTTALTAVHEDLVLARHAGPKRSMINRLFLPLNST